MNQMRDKMRSALRVEGQDHINISVASSSRLGKLLSPDLRRNFFIPHLGDFGSPRCFANWLVSKGNEKLRNSHEHYVNRAVSADVYRLYLLYAKHFQIFSIRRTFMDLQDQLDLPFVMYRTYVTGIKEFDRWEDYPRLVRVLVEHAVNPENNVKLDWNSVAGKKLVREISSAVREISIANGVAEDQVVDLFVADKVQEERRNEAKQQREVRRLKSQVRQVSPALAPTDSPVTNENDQELVDEAQQPQEQPAEQLVQQEATLAEGQPASTDTAAVETAVVENPQ